MKLYFVKSATADNYILADTSRGLIFIDCAPYGSFAEVELSTIDTDPESIVSAIRYAIDPDIDESDFDYMPTFMATIDDFIADQERFESFDQDELFLIGEYGTKLWYAVMADRDDTDWGTGSYDLDKAKEMCRHYKDGYIAVIRDGGDPVCVEEIEQEDF